MNNTYLIIGASSDVGMEYIMHLQKVERDALIIAHYRTNNKTLVKLAANAEQNQMELFQADLSNEEDVIKMLNMIEEKYSCPTHILHLPADKLEYMKIKQFSWDNIIKDMEIQVKSLGMILQRFLPKMSKAKHGKVAVMLSSVTLGMPPKFMTGYVINKYALMGLMKSAAMEYADKGININGISPNMMDTKFLEKIDARLVELTAEQSVMKRNIMISEVIPCIQLLLSEGSDYMNGVNINLSGGDY